MTIRYALFWIAAACCVVAELVILRSLLFGRAREHERRSAAPRHGSRTAEIAWAIIPAVGLALVLYLTWQAVGATSAPPAAMSHSGATIGA